MENSKIHFNKVSEDEKGIAEKIIKKYKEDGAEKIPNEYEKTEDELKAIRVVNEILQKELIEIGIEPRESLSPERVHVISESIAKSLNLKSDAVYNSLTDSVLLNKDVLKSRMLIYKTILHEAIHYYSFKSTIADGELKKVKNYRSGYSLENQGDEKEYRHFKGFNEAVVEKIMYGILIKNLQRLKSEFSITENELKVETNWVSGYYLEMLVLDFIIAKISEANKKEPEEIWIKIKKGLFTGEMMHLRDIEKVFGPGSLRVLASMLSKGSTKEMSESEMFNNLIGFFDEENKDKRDKFAKAILSERENLKYNS